MNKHFKIGIVTMHRVLNYGSALQAFALQTKIEKMGFDAEIIDYVFPNKENVKLKVNFLIRYVKKIKHLVFEIIFGFPEQVRMNRFKQFYNCHYQLSTDIFLSKEELDKNPPFYDLLITGSDQVWNPKHIGKDTTFMLSFCKDDTIPRISYASSFATGDISEKLKPLYTEYLSKYKNISVRESSGVKIINDLILKKATVVFDPTLLLNRFEWSKIADYSKIKIKQPYLLAYILTYAYDPYPEIDRLIRNLQEMLGIQIIFINGKITNYKHNRSTIIRDAGPYEFVKLFMDAQYVITTSFHGTAFALNFSVPFYSVVDNKADEDSRMINLLQMVGAENRAIPIDCKDFNPEPMDYHLISEKINKLRNQSLNFLSNSIKENLQEP